MTPPRPRGGIYATIAGRVYQAEGPPVDGHVMLVRLGEQNPDPELFSWSPAHEAWAVRLPTAECDRLVEVRSETEYEALRCQVIDVDDAGSVGLYYVGPEKAAAQQCGFTQIDVGTWAKTVNVHEIGRYYEMHHDFLFVERASRLSGGADV